METDEARDIITAIIGPVDRPWDTRFAVASEWATPEERPRVIEAGRALGFA